MKQVIVFTFALLLAGCSAPAHSPFIAKDTTDTHKLTATKFPSHTNKVFLTEVSLPKDIKFEEIALIEVGKATYGDYAAVYESMAAKAKELGADAVIEIKTWRQVSGWAWAAPHGSGKAVKFADKNSVDLSAIKGQWQ